MTRGAETTAKPIVFYDGSCPLCRREIGHYRRLDRACAVDWRDIHRNGAALDAAGITPDEAMRRLHALEAGGEISTGINAFLVIWRALPRYRWLAALIERCHLTRPLEWLYTRFAAWRYRRRCRTCCTAQPRQ
ncbi:redox protein [Marinobacterium nitratireducens]|uniref:Redox protein n=1 Tax=Marinobacterium nitratireducens TaxID=518897 RepID=A0A917ZI19_9GAMM|nr:DUF393 domain-containing protein [Marinobacterium nitratireducens]GGO83361.1 redox protein [Marinobacterium nitratireducens]